MSNGSHYIQMLKVMSKSGYAEMVLLGIILAIVVFWMGDSLTSPPDRVSRIYGYIIGLLLLFGIRGLLKLYRAAKAELKP